MATRSEIFSSFAGVKHDANVMAELAALRAFVLEVSRQTVDIGNAGAIIRAVSAKVDGQRELVVRPLELQAFIKDCESQRQSNKERAEDLCELWGIA